MDRQTMIVMCGLPRSGKSTYVDGHFSNFQIVCADDIRLALGTQFDEKLENFVWGVHNTMIRAHLERGYNVVIDSTNTTIHTIERYSNLAREYDYRFIIDVIVTPIEECLKRNVGHGAVPENVIVRMQKQLWDLMNNKLDKYEVNYI